VWTCIASSALSVKGCSAPPRRRQTGRATCGRARGR